MSDVTEGTPNINMLLDWAVAFLCRYVVFQSPHQPTALALWAAMTHAVAAFDVAAYVSISSAELGSGKSRALECLDLLVYNPWRVAEPSVAVVFRKLNRDKPTLLLDETDAIFSKRKEERHEDLRSMLNAGYRRGVAVPRCVGEGAKQELRDFEVFGPKVLAGIGTLPGTIADRCIPIRLPKKAPHEHIEKWRFKNSRAEAAPIRDSLKRWAAGAIPALRDAQPQVPDIHRDRVEEIWEPLLAVADMAGGEWPRRSREAMISLHGDHAIREEMTGTLFLQAIREVFGEKKVQEISTADLLLALVNRDDTPAAEWWGRDIKVGEILGPARRLANLLRQYEIEPIKWRSEDQTVRGYRRVDFEDPWSRYLPHTTPLPLLQPGLHATDATTPDNQESARGFADGTLDATEPLTPQHEPLWDEACGIVALSTLFGVRQPPITTEMIPAIARRLGGEVVEVRRHMQRPATGKLPNALP